MTDKSMNRPQQLFLEALAIPAEERNAWLSAECGDDKVLLARVQMLLAHDDLSNDPLEMNLPDALDISSSTLVWADSDRTTGEGDGHTAEIDSDVFLSELSRVGVLSQEELQILSDSISSSEEPHDPRELAAQLVANGKLTAYQARALLQGQPDLLLDKYLILDLIGAGGMGLVFKAIHRPMNRTVAVKMISQKFLNSSEQIKRFQREVRVAATLEHPNVVRAYDADQANGVHFLVLEYVRGENLAERVLRDGPLPVEDAVDAMIQSARGLGYAHEQGVVHRDVKPGNLMRNTRGMVKVLDLGLANVDDSFRIAQQSSAVDTPVPDNAAVSDLTSAGAVLGTVSYMAPEQTLKANKADARSDIYSLGCTLYYLLVGEPPYPGETVFEVFDEHRDGEIPSLRIKRADVPAGIDAICTRMLAKSPDDRYQSMDELIAALQACGISAPDAPQKQSPAIHEHTTRKAPTTPTAKKPQRKLHQNSWQTWAILLTVLIGGSYGLSLLMGPTHRPGDSQARVNSVNSDNSYNLASPTEKNTGALENDESINASRDWYDWPADAPKPAIAPFDSKQAKAHQEAWAKYLGIPVEYTNSIGMTLRLIPPGRFLMGSSKFEIEEAQQAAGGDNAWKDHIRGEGPRHTVVLTQPFFIGITEVTQKQFRRVLGTNPSRFSEKGNGKELIAELDSDDLPVDNVSWNDAAEFCKKLSLHQRLDSFYSHDQRSTVMQGIDYRLPTEAEWEYSCRAGTSTKFWHGNRDSHLNQSGWFLGNSGGHTHPVAKLNRNPFGLFDTHGNVWEWVHDSWDPAFYSKFSDQEAVNPYNPFDLSGLRVVRGGGWNHFSSSCRSAPRYGFNGKNPKTTVGFRVALPVEAVKRVLDVERSNALSSDYALQFDGQDDWCELPTLPIGDGPCTFEMVVHAGRQRDPYAHVFATNQSGNQFSFGIDDGGGASFGRVSEGKLESTFKKTLLDATMAKPTHIACVWDGNELSLFFDGQLASRGTMGTYPTRVRYALQTSLCTAVIIQNGRPTPRYFCKALVDELRVSKSARYLDSFAPIKPGQRFVSDQETVALYHFDEGRGDVLTDSSGNGHHGKILGAKWVKTEVGLDDKSTISAADLLATGDYEWRTVERLPEPINSKRDEYGADMSADGLTIVFASNRSDGSYGMFDLWISTRDSLNDPWTKPRNLGPKINSDRNEVRPALDPMCFTLAYDTTNQIEESEARISTRANAFAKWSAPVLPTKLGYPKSMRAFDITKQNRFLVSDRFGSGRIELVQSNRGSIHEPWPNFSAIPPPINEEWDSLPSISNDGRLLVFHRKTDSNRIGDMYMSWRRDIAAEWSRPVPIDALNSYSGKYVRLLPDDRSILFCANGDDGSEDDADIYLARLVRKDAPDKPIKGLEGGQETDSTPGPENPSPPKESESTAGD